MNIEDIIVKKSVKNFLIGLIAAAAPAAASAQAGEQPSLPLSDRSANISTVAAAQLVSFEVYFPLRNESELDVLIKQQHDPLSANYHKWLTPSQFAEKFGPAPEAMVAARDAMSLQGFSVIAAHASSFTVTGTAAALNRTFGTSLKLVTHADGSHQLVSASPVTLPAALKAQGATVVAFANRPNMRINSRFLTVPANRSSDHGPYWFTDLRQAYNYPALNVRMVNGQYLDGAGVSVAIVMASDALDSDVAAMFNHEKYSAISGRRVPKLIHVPINGGGGADPNNGAFGESALDTQQVLGGAPGAMVSILNIPSLSDQNILDAYLKIVQSNAYDIVSSSFGGCELAYSAAYNSGVDNTAVLRTYSVLFKQGNAQGITWVASSGDSGGLSCPSVNYFTGQGQAKFVPSVQFPSADPNVTGVGGGNLVTTAPGTPSPLNSAYVMENAYGDPEIPYDIYGVGQTVSGGYWGAGGGQSTVFKAPAYQSLVKTGSLARTIPDVGMQVGGCPGGLSAVCGPQRSAVYIYQAGSIGGVIGTSVSAPEFAGALALFVQRKGRQGNLNTFLYKQAAAQTAKSSLGYYNQNIRGFDGKWSNTYPGGGYDYLYGNGSPRVRYLFGFTDLPAAGAPQTPSNP